MTRSFRSERKRSYKNGIIKSIWCLFEVQQKGIPCICEQLLFDGVKSNSEMLTANRRVARENVRLQYGNKLEEPFFSHVMN